MPFRFTRSYSERCVRRRVFGNDNALTFVTRIEDSPPNGLAQYAFAIVIHGSVQKKSSTENRGKTSQRKNFSLIAPATPQVFPLRQPAIR